MVVMCGGVFSVLASLDVCVAVRRLLSHDFLQSPLRYRANV